MILNGLMDIWMLIYLIDGGARQTGARRLQTAQEGQSPDAFGR